MSMTTINTHCFPCFCHHVFWYYSSGITCIINHKSDSCQHCVQSIMLIDIAAWGRFSIIEYTERRDVGCQKTTKLKPNKRCCCCFCKNFFQILVYWTGSTKYLRILFFFTKETAVNFVTKLHFTSKLKESR